MLIQGMYCVIQPRGKYCFNFIFKAKDIEAWRNQTICPKLESLRGQKVKGGVLGHVECTRKGEGDYPGMIENT